MKVLLVGPTSSPETAYQAKRRIFPPLGVYRLKFWLENKTNAEVDVINPELTNPWNYIDENSGEYDIIGISTLFDTFENDISVARYARVKNYDSTIIVGGIQATFAYDDVIRYAKPDYVCRGEGEYFLTSLIQEGHPKQKSLTEKEFNEASLILDYTKMDLERCWRETKKRLPKAENVRTVRIFTESKCPKGCNFCSATNYPAGVNFLYPDVIINMVSSFEPLDPELIFFHGENFLLGQRGKDRLRRFEGYESPYPVLVQCDSRDVDKDSVKKLKELGVVKVSLGVDNLSDNILLDLGKKGLTYEKIKEVIDCLLDENIDVFCNIILSSPGAKMEDVDLCVRRIRELMERGVEFGINLYPIPFPGTKFNSRFSGAMIYSKAIVPYFNDIIHKPWKYLLLPENKKLKMKILEIEKQIKGLKLPSERLSEVIVEIYENINF